MHLKVLYLQNSPFPFFRIANSCQRGTIFFLDSFSSTEFSFPFFRKANSSLNGTIVFVSVSCLGTTAVCNCLLSDTFFGPELICEITNGGKNVLDVVQPSGDEDDNLGIFGFDGEQSDWRDDIDKDPAVGEEKEVGGIVKALVNEVEAVACIGDLEIGDTGIETDPENIDQGAPDSVVMIGEK